MRFPSVRVLAVEAGRTLRSYPLVLLAAAVAAFAAIGLAESEQNKTLIRLLLTAQPGVPLFFAITIFGCRLSPALRRTVEVVGLGLLVAWFFSIDPRFETAMMTRFIEFNVGLHLLVAFLPFARTAGVDGFWQYNKTLFLRFLLAVLYSHVLFAGLSVALLATDKLLGVPVADEAYLRMWLVIVFLFNTWFFVGGVSVDSSHFETVDDYPTGLKVFTQYVLVPLVIIYLLILTTYLGKVLVTRSWPSGWIGWLVSSVAAVGILAMLLVHPIKDREGSAWVRTFSRWFYVFLLPSIGMLFMAIFKRIAQYGVTENRYFLLVLTCWLLGTAIYFIVSRSRNIKSIPLTLCILAFVTAYGPWGAFSISQRSQVSRLHAVLDKNGLIENGHLVETEDEVSFDDRKEMSAILYYLADVHGLECIDSWFDPPLALADSLAGDQKAYRGRQIRQAKAAMARLGLEYVESWATANRDYFTIGVTTEPRLRPIDGYQYYCHMGRYSMVKGKPVTIDGTDYALVYEKDAHEIAFQRGDTTLVAISLDPLLDDIRAGDLIPMTYDTDPERLRIGAEQDGYRILVYFNNISGPRRENGYEINFFEADCFISLP